MDYFLGQTLGERYHLIERIGEGGMALVYKANDLLLSRTVAVKVLRPQFANDSQFVERFRREAQAAARLSHPNVVNIYDVGQDLSAHFIVMEYVQGKNLKRLIDEARQPFSVDFVVDIGIQISKALEHAHSKEVIHRDIKPHNIIITPDNVVKVTDFGIARAVSSSTLTQTGTIIGSVHYFSPEQAKGANIGPQSDIYSLGIVLFELLTGHVPYSGDSPIAIALKHAQEEVPSARQENPKIPVFLDHVIRKAMAKDLADRYRTAHDIRIELERVRWSDADRGRKLLPPGELDETLVMQRSSLNQEEKRVAKSGSIWKRVFLALLFLGLAGLAFLFVVFPSLVDVREVIVPEVVGLSLDEAQETLNRIGLTLEVERKVYDEKVPKDHIVEQDPRPNRWIKVSRSVKVLVSLGPQLVTMPDLIGMTPREARVALSQAGLTIGSELKDFSSQIQEGRIMLQDPPPFAKVEKNSAVTITLSRGPAPDMVIVPDFTGLSYEQALEELRSVGLIPGRIIEESYSPGNLRPGTVIDQNPPAGVSLSPGASVDFVVTPDQDQTPDDGPDQLPDVNPPDSEPPVPPGEEPNLPPEENPAEPEEDPAGEAPAESPLNEVKRAEIQVLVPPGPAKQLIQIIVIDSYPAREVYSRLHSPGDRVVQIVEGYGPEVTIQVYIDGVMYKEQSFRN